MLMLIVCQYHSVCMWFTLHGSHVILLYDDAYCNNVYHHTAKLHAGLRTMQSEPHAD